MIKALNEYVLLEKIEEEKSAFEIPDQKEKPGKGKVVSIGKIECDVKVGDTVYFAQYAPTEIEFDGVTYLSIQEKSLICKE